MPQTEYQPNVDSVNLVDWQAAYDDATPHVATAPTTGQDIGLTSRTFVAQGLASN